MEQEEAARAVAAADTEAVEEADAMEVDGEEAKEEENDEENMEHGEDDKDSSAAVTAHNLDKKLATPAGKKRWSEALSKTKKAAPTGVHKTYAATTTALHPRSFVPHNYTYPRAIIVGSARLVQEDKAKEFMDLVISGNTSLQWKNGR